MKIVSSGNELGDVAAGDGRDERTSGVILDLEAADESIKGGRGGEFTDFGVGFV